MERNYSRDALLKFTATLGEKGLANQNTAEGMRVAVSKILADLSPEEESDVRKVDLETAVHRFFNKNPGAVSPKSLTEYRRRVALAIRLFESYLENPTGFRPIGRGSGAGTKAPSPEKKRETKTTVKQPVGKTPPPAGTTTQLESNPSSTSLVLSYPLRPDFLAQVLVPRDLRRDEAKRMSAFIMTLASDFVPDA